MVRPDQALEFEYQCLAEVGLWYLDDVAVVEIDVVLGSCTESAHEIQDWVEHDDWLGLTL